MGFILSAIENVKDFFSSILNKIRERSNAWNEHRQRLRERSDYIRQIEQFESTYCPEEPDQKLALRVQQYLEEKFPNGIEERLSQMSVDELPDFFIEIEKEAEEIMDVTTEETVIVYPTTEEENMKYGCGFYNRKDNLLCINGVYLYSGDTELIKEQIFTIFHELKHARQWAAIEHRKDYGYSEELIQVWEQNMRNYISPYESDEAYRKQPVELDTFGFEEQLKEGYYTNN